ncbi:MAG: PIN domain-containing protein [Nitrospirae bacterium]|nr:PIN domain-containing protein [Nitrospirota bacterium]
MPDKIFVDTNVLIYFISHEKKKKLQARDIIFSSEEVYISSQVISEFISVCYSKNLLKTDDVISVTSHFLEALRFTPIEESTIRNALQVKKKSQYSFWDSLVIASALENRCSILYTEDMQEGQIIDGRLTIVNPFKE